MIAPPLDQTSTGMQAVCDVAMEPEPNHTSGSDICPQIDKFSNLPRRIHKIFHKQLSSMRS